MQLDQKGKVLAEYIWIDGSNGLRNKTKVSSPPTFSGPSAPVSDIVRLGPTRVGVGRPVSRRRLHPTLRPALGLEPQPAQIPPARFFLVAAGKS